MMRCNRCGTAHETGARFCVGCGAALEASAPPGPPANPPPNYGAAPYPGAQVPPGMQMPPGAPMQHAAPQHGVPMQHGAPQHGAQVPHGGWGQADYRDAPPASMPSGQAGLPAWPGPAATNQSPVYPGSDGLGMHQPAGARPQPVAAHALAYAETSPPVYDEHALSRPIPDRGRRRIPQDDRGTDAPPPHARAAEPPLVGAYDPLSVPRDAPRVLSGFLVSYESNPLGQFWPLFQGGNLIGRLGAGVGADVELPHATVSSRHAVFHASAHPGRIVVLDQGSTNGTYVNDSPLTQDQPRELRDADRVRLGLYTLIVKIL